MTHIHLQNRELAHLDQSIKPAIISSRACKTRSPACFKKTSACGVARKDTKASGEKKKVQRASFKASLLCRHTRAVVSTELRLKVVTSLCACIMHPALQARHCYSAKGCTRGTGCRRIGSLGIRQRRSRGFFFMHHLYLKMTCI